MMHVDCDPAASEVVTSALAGGPLLWKKFQPMHKICPCQDDDVKVNDKFTWLPKILTQLRLVEFFQDWSLRDGISFPAAHPADRGKGLGIGRSCNKFMLL
ncbi:atrial natriuretic peptide-converting enzyme [Platysternon megacephalum]|uniref:Atrial natriuretic peptide-converting enzyme n=1 Tax=Platysternon megacephalum TaxID=55544 RepID=A0A4D9F3T7_9SAUR|nr:atrial natriuretic peptide-converting enzyme [Platysternon megacephalum]